MEALKIYVISLPGSFERRRFITEQLNSLELSYTLFDAIDGNALSEEEFNSKVDAVAIAPKLKWLTKGAVGCALSHIEVYKRIAQDNVPFALVLEDDCILHDKFPQLLASIPNSIEGTDVVMLYYSSGEPIQLKQNTAQDLASGFKLYDVVEPENIFSTVAYIISREASEKLADFALPVKTTADNWGFYIQHKVINKLKCVYPMPVDTADFKSTIGYLSDASFLGRLSSWVDKYKIFPVHQLLKFRRRKALKRRKCIELVS